MPRQRIRKTSQGMISKNIMIKAAEEVLKNGKSIRSVSKAYNICHVTLSRFVRKTEFSRDSPEDAAYPVIGYIPHNRVFTDHYEEKLVKYINHCADLYYGLTTSCVRKLAYQVASYYKLQMPDNWNLNQMAGEEWLKSFLKRNKTLAIRKPEPTSLSRSMCLAVNAIGNAIPPLFIFPLKNTIRYSLKEDPSAALEQLISQDGCSPSS